MRPGLRRRLLLIVATAVAVAIFGLVGAFVLVLDKALMRDANTLVRTRASAELTTLRLTKDGVEETEAPDDAAPTAGIWVFSNGRLVEKPRAGKTVQQAARVA